MIGSALGQAYFTSLYLQFIIILKNKERVLKKLHLLLAKNGFHFLLGAFFTFIFVWPFLTIMNLSDNYFIFYYLYGAWLIVIVFHFIMDKFNIDNEDNVNEEPKN